MSDRLCVARYRVAIRRGTHGTGEITLRTGRGAYGKSGKMEIQLRSIEIGGRQVALTGKYREEGEGKTGFTVDAVALRAAPPRQMAQVFVAPQASYPVRDWTPTPAALPSVAPSSVTYASYAPDTGGQSSVEVFQRRLAAAQPVRRANAQQGWTITD